MDVRSLEALFERELEDVRAVTDAGAKYFVWNQQRHESRIDLQIRIREYLLRKYPTDADQKSAALALPPGRSSSAVASGRHFTFGAASTVSTWTGEAVRVSEVRGLFAASAFWVIAVVLFVLLFEPFGYYMREKHYWTTGKVIFFPIVLGIVGLAIIGWLRRNADSTSAATNERSPISNQVIPPAHDATAEEIPTRTQPSAPEGQDYAKILEWSLNAAHKGDAEGQFNLGLLYRHGRGVPQDTMQAIIWYRKAADQRFAPAQNNLGSIYVNGEGVPQDYEQALIWFRKAAEQGYAPAQYNLGGLYRYGNGVPLDHVQAINWYRRAADQGSGPSQNSLGVMYSRGEGEPRDYVQAYKWFSLAAWRSSSFDKGDRGTPEVNLRAVAAKMKRSQIAEGQTLAAEWELRQSNKKSSEKTPHLSPLDK